MIQRRTWATSALVAAATAFPLLVAGPAQAHAVPDSRYYRTTVTNISPRISGLRVTASPKGEWIEVANQTRQVITVLGYAGEPYLRIGPSGVDENTTSLSSYLNSAFVIQRIPQAGELVVQPPQWVHRGPQTSYRWHDHRIHWMSNVRPDIVRSDPAHVHRVLDWTIRLLVGTTPVAIHGTLDWLGTVDNAWLNDLLLPLQAAFGILVAYLIIHLLIVARRSARRRSAALATPEGEERQPSEPPTLEPLLVPSEELWAPPARDPSANAAFPGQQISDRGRGRSGARRDQDPVDTSEGI